MQYQKKKKNMNQTSRYAFPTLKFLIFFKFLKIQFAIKKKKKLKNISRKEKKDSKSIDMEKLFPNDLKCQPPQRQNMQIETTSKLTEKKK